MSQKSRIRYDRNRRQRVRILPAGQGQLFDGRTMKKVKIPKATVEAVSSPDSVELFCPRCGDPLQVDRVHITAIEYKGKCGGCGWKFIYMQYSNVTQVLTIGKNLR